MTNPEPTDNNADANGEEGTEFARKIRRLMLISGLTTAVAIGAVFMAIGYRLFRGEGSRVSADMTAMLPKGAKIVSSAVASDRLVVTVDAGGRIEIHTFDVHSLRPTGKLKFAQEP